MDHNDLIAADLDKMIDRQKTIIENLEYVAEQITQLATEATEGGYIGTEAEAKRMARECEQQLVRARNLYRTLNEKYEALE